MLQLRRERSGLSAENPRNLSYCYYCSCSRDWPTFDGATESDKVYPVLFNVSTPATPATLATLYTECSHTPSDYAQLHEAYKSISIVRILRTVNLLEVCALLQRIRAGEEVQSLLSAAQEGGLLLQLVQTERSDRRPSTPKARARCHFHSEGDPTGGVLRSSVARTVSSVLGESADQQ